VVLLLVGGAVLRISLSDVYLRYVKEGLRPFLIVAGILLVLIAVATLWRELARNRVVSTYDGKHERPEGDESLLVGSQAAPVHGLDPDDDGHGHGHGGPKVAWLLVLPVFAVFLVAPPALGSYSASRAAANSTVQEQSDFSELPPGDPVKLTTVDYATRAIWDKGKTMKDRRLKLSGFLSPRPGGGFYLTRIMLSCCAADGRPIKVGLSGDAPAGMKADSWIEVIGEYDSKFDTDRASGAKIPYIKVSEVKQIQAPAQPYEQ
jgi:uncharacterized repeat protein (TIGR03943 family)